MDNVSEKPVVIVGGGPAGSVAALCLRKLGREVILFEKQKFPRYRIGESLLPGTMSILTRLGVFDRIAAAGFTKKRAATFIWGPDQAPWTFTFSTPKTAPWVFDHSYQVTRAEYDQILLDAAQDWGTEIKQECIVRNLEVESRDKMPRVDWEKNGAKGSVEAAFVVDASGASGVIANKLKLRRFDEYYKNMAVWSYFKGGKRYKGDLEGNIFSVTFREGWIWIIPLKDDIYSVGVVTDNRNVKRTREIGVDAFYSESLQMCPLAMEILSGAKQCDKVRVVRDWAYDASSLSMGRAFLCGDSACFIDPLFSQGVHLATYSAMCASAAIDYLYDNPEGAEEIHSWYDNSYREAYNRYHQFLSAFYTANAKLNTPFWAARRIEGAGDKRFEGKDWFTALTGQRVEGGESGIDELEERAATLADLWHHNQNKIDDRFDETELSLRRVRWASELLKQFRSMEKIRWLGKECRLVNSFKVDPSKFTLERQSFIGNEDGRTMRAFPLTEKHRTLFQTMIDEPLSYKVLTARLKTLDGHGTPLQIVGRLIESNFLEGRNKNGELVKVRAALRFGGVGAEDDIS